MPPTPLLPWRPVLRAFFFALLAVAIFGLVARSLFLPNELPPQPKPFIYGFDDDGILHESESPETSSSPYWWVDSGGKLLVENGVGKTLQGALPASDPWRERYRRSSSADTDGGRHPQNLFRLITKSAWDDVRVEASFRIVDDHFSESENRNESNGVLLLSRYHDGDNTYYAGLRVDGHAVIKKKRDGVYETLAEKPVYEGAYSRGKRINLLPHDEWLTLRMETKTTGDAVAITLSQKDESGGWHTLLTATDTASIIEGPAPTGIRTDFMDVEFDDFQAEEI